MRSPAREWRSRAVDWSRFASKRRRRNSPVPTSTTAMIPAKLRWSLDRAAPHQGAQAGQELGVREWLGQVVVGAAIEARDPVPNGVAGREHQHRGPDANVSQTATDLKAVDSRQHQVEDDRVVLGGLRSPKRVLAICRHVRGHAFLAQAAPDQAGHLDVVFNDQDAHCLTPRGACTYKMKER